ncbi:MAG: MBL fold metallo-hydrolase [Halobacteriales archaeon]
MSESDTARQQPPPGSPSVHRLGFTTDWAPGTAYAYLIDGPEPILIDAGVPGEDAYEEFTAELAAVDYAIEDIDHLLLTHPHDDHMGQVPAVIEETDDVTIYVYESVRDRIERPIGRITECVRANATGAGLEESRVDDIVEGAVESAREKRELLPIEAIDVELVHGETFTVAGHRFEAIYTPGHQAEHICFQLTVDGNHADVMFSGDALIEPFRAVPVHVGFDAGVYDCLSAYLTAYDRLAGRDVAWVNPGHGPQFERYAATVANSRSDIESVISAVETIVEDDGPVSPVGITVTRKGGLEYLTNLMDTMGALGYLETQGRIVYDVTADGVRLYRPS